MSLSRRHLRCLAACVLLGWLLAVGVSVARACGLASGSAAAGHGEGVTTVRAVPAHAVLVANTSEQPAADADACAKFCDETKASPSSAGTIAATVPPLVNSVPLPAFRPDAPALSLGAGWMHDPDWRPARSLAIELVRLTL